MSACILVVDDNHDILALLDRLLTGQGHDVLTFESPLTALEAAKDNFIDLAILDIGMPEMDGLALGAEIKKAQVPFMFLSAFADTQYMTRAKKAGALELLIKPVRNEQLVLSVANALELARRGADKNIMDPRLQRVINIAVGVYGVKEGLTARESYASIRNEARASGRKILDVANDILDGHDHFVRLYRGDHPSLNM